MKKTNHSPIAQLHDGMQAWLMETGLRLQRTDLSDKSQQRELLNGLHQLLHAEQQVTEAEERLLFPLLMDSAPYLVCQFEKEHGQLAVLRQSLSDAVFACAVAIEQGEAGMQLQMAFTSYMAFLFQHGLRERVVIQGVWSHTVTEETSGKLGRDIFLSLPREQRSTLMSMMMNATHGEDRRSLRAEFRATGQEFLEALRPVSAEIEENGQVVEKRVRMTVAA